MAFAGLLLLGLAAGAVLALNWSNFGPALSGTPTAGVLSRQQAVEAAIRIGIESRPEMNGSSIPPNVVDARQTTLLEALHELDPSTRSVPQGERPNLPVWLVRMDGSWQGAAAPDLPTPLPYLHMAVILNGITGEYLGSWNGPGEPQINLASPPPLTPTADGNVTAAQSALENFLGSLAAGPADQKFYQRASALYGGSWAELIALDKSESYGFGLFKTACEQAGYHCLTVRKVSPPEKLAAMRYRLWVQFNQNDGSLYTNIDGATWFDFEVMPGIDGQFQVMDLPPNDQIFGPVVAHLSEAETAGLDETGILRALWVDYMQRCQSPYLAENERITDYEIVSIQAGFITFSVQPAKMLYSDWVAGNGEIQGDWVRNKGLFVRVFEEGGAWHLKMLGTGP